VGATHATGTRTRESSIAQEFKKAPWAFYRGIVVLIALATAGSELYALFG